MKVGILQCDIVRDVFRDQGFEDYPSMIQAGFQEIGADFEFETFCCVNGELPADVSACDAYITSGSRFSVLDPDQWIRNLEQFVLQLVEAKVPYVGICFGHQLLAQAMGGLVEKADVGWGVGVSINELKQPHAALLRQSEDGQIRLIVSHQDQVTQVPTELSCIGGSDFCPNYFFTLDDHVLTIQGHPEFTREYSNALMEFRRDIIPEDVVNMGQKSLQGRVDRELVFEWISSFIMNASKSSAVKN